MRPVVGVMAVLFRNEKVLMIRRSKEPDAGRWSLPAGKIEAGEEIRDAAQRELFEETGISAEVGRVITAVDAIEKDENGIVCSHFVIIAVSCHSDKGDLLAGDDAIEARWVSAAEIVSLDLASGFDIRAVLEAASLESG